jgi:RNA-directed DNA polymerase
MAECRRRSKPALVRYFLQKLQTALHAKAKESPNRRFHALYDKVYRKDVLAYAYERCQANGGAAGVDNQTFENIEAYGKERWLGELRCHSVPNA